jgi:hypothetical protein
VKIQDAKKKPKMAEQMLLPTTATYLQLKESAEKVVAEAKQVQNNGELPGDISTPQHSQDVLA